MRLFQISTLLLLFSQSVTIDGSAIVASAPKCDKKCAKSLIQRKPHSKSYCSSYLRAHGATKRTVTVTTTAKTSCVTVTKTSVTTDLDIFSVASVTVTLPVITITEYSSTVVIVTGPTRVIDRRAVEETAIGARAAAPAPCPCRNLSSCSSNIISAACLEIAPLPTITKTITKPCTKTTTTTVTTGQFTMITSGTQTITPPADTTTLNQVLTTYVPEECTRELYSPPLDLDGASIVSVDYPFYAITPIECCGFCFRTKNCAASAYSASINECALLVVDQVQPGEKSGMCPLGRQNFTFIRDFDFGVNTLPGPCGF
ncbi:hypothetical protein TWF281_009183 [Arthrobotrys megalospora]